MLTGLLIVDHGSRRDEANAALEQICELVRAAIEVRAKTDSDPARIAAATFVTHAHMELAKPSIPEAVAACVAAGCEHLVVMPYFLFSGRHVSEDVPRLVASACASFDGLTFGVVEPLGVHAKLAELVLERAGL